MTFSETPIYTPKGWVEARNLKEGESVYSWNGSRWIENPILKVKQSAAKTWYSLISFDGVVPRHLRCDEQQEICVKGRHYYPPPEIRAGEFVTMSEGTNVFRSEVGVVEKMTTIQPEVTVGFALKKRPQNFLGAGFLCRA